MNRAALVKNNYWGKMAQILVAFLSAGLLVATCSAHMCLINPKQRGSIKGLNNPGADDCILNTGPCGGRPVEQPKTVFKSGSNETIIFQKNLDHWNSATPGFFALTLMNSAFQKTVYTIADTQTKSLTLYNAVVDLTGVPKDTYILQATYVPKNPQAPAVFYQCSDIDVA